MHHQKVGEMTEGVNNVVLSDAQNGAGAESVRICSIALLYHSRKLTKGSNIDAKVLDSL